MIKLDKDIIIKKFSSFEDIKKTLDKINNSYKYIKIAHNNKENIDLEDYIKNIKEKIDKYNNSNIDENKLIEINCNLKGENVEMINVNDFYIWIFGKELNLLSWSAKPPKKEMLEIFELIDYNNFIKEY